MSVLKRAPPCLFILLLGAQTLCAEDWYISNASGMLLEKTYKTRALRSKYAVSLQIVRRENVPKEISKYYSPPWRIECRILYENLKRIRTQWVFKDSVNATLFAAVVGEDGSGFLEWYDDHGFVMEEQRLNADGSGYFVAYTYKNGFLIKAEAHIVEAAVQKKDAAAKNAEAAAKETAAGEIKNAPPETETKTPTAESGSGSESGAAEAAPADAEESVAGIDAARSDGSAESPAESAAVESVRVPPVSESVRSPQGPAEIPEFFVAVTGREGGSLWTDTYKYTRTGTLRGVVRTFHTAGSDKSPEWTRFPRFIKDSPTDTEFVQAGTSLVSSFILNAFPKDDKQVVYNTDSKQRVLSEIHKNSEGEVTGELTNTWSEDRIESVNWKSEGDERRIDYGYNGEGERISEKDYRNGVLERSVVIDGTREIEELYLDGEPVLRAVWEGGKKISEERLQTRKMYKRENYEEGENANKGENANEDENENAKQQ